MANEKKIRIVVDAKGAQRALSQLDQKLSESGKSATGMNTRMLALKQGAIAMAGVTAAVGGAIVATTAFAAATAKAVTEMDVFAKRANVTIGTFQAWSAEAQKIGVGNDELSNTFKDLADRQGEFIRNWQRTGDIKGGGEFTDIYTQYLKPLGVGLEELRNLKPDEILNMVKKGMEEAGANTAEMISTFEQLASNSSHLIPLLDGTGQKMNAVKDAMQRDGKILTQDDVDKARQLDEQSKELEKTWESIKTSVGLAAAGPATAFLKFLDDALIKMRDLSDKASALGKWLSTDAQLENIKKIDQRTPTDQKIYRDNTSVTDTFASFGYNRESTGGVDANSESGGKKRTEAEAESNAAQLEAQKEAAAAYIEVIAQRNMDEFTLLDEKQAMEIEKLNQFREIGAISDAEHKAAMLELEQSYADSIYGIMENESNKEAALRKKDAEDEAKAKEKSAKDAANKRKSEQKDVTNMAYQTNSMLDNVAKLAQGRSDKLNALAQGAATFQATINMYTAASQAMADWSAFTPMQKAANVAMIMGMGANLLSGITGAGRQSGGYMQANTPYQVGGGAHTDTPEMYQSGGKSYIVDSQAGMMKRVSGNASSGGGAINMQLINNGEPMSYTMQQDSIDEQGVRNIVMEMTPQILRDQAGNDQSDFSKAFGSIRNQDWSFT